MATLLLIVIYITFIGLGLPDSLLGAAWPQMYLEFGIPVSIEAVCNAVVVLGTIASSINAARLLHRFGTLKIVIGSTLLTALAMLGFSFAPSILCVLLLAIPLGIGAGAIDTALNNFLALHYAPSQMNWLHCFWGIGAVSGPLILSRSMRASGDWRTGYLVIGVLQYVIVLILLLSVPAWRAIDVSEACGDTRGKPPRFSELVRTRGVKLTMLIFFCYCAAEYTMVCWGSTYLVRCRGLDAPTAAGWVSLYYAGVTVGRMICGFLTLKLHNRTVITAGLCMLLTAACLLLLPLPAKAAMFGFLMVGLGCAPVMPGLIADTPIRFGRELSQSVIGLEITSAYVGILVLPTAFGFLANAVSMRLFPILIGLLGLVLLCGTRRLNRLTPDPCAQPSVSAE